MKLFEALGLDIRILIAQFVNFAILFFVLYKFGYKPIFDFLNTRKSNIEKGIQNAKDADAKLIKIQEREKEVLAQARKESRGIIMVAEQLAQKNKEEIIYTAQKEAEKIILLAQKNIEEERKQALLGVKKELSGLVISATEKILSEKIDIEKDKALINKVISEVA